METCRCIPAVAAPREAQCLSSKSEFLPSYGDLIRLIVYSSIQCNAILLNGVIIQIKENSRNLVNQFIFEIGWDNSGCGMWIFRSQSYNYRMNRCEHGQRITKFCVTQHCHHKEAAGCDYCIRKYHFHLTNTLLLSEVDLEELVRKVALPSDTKYKTRNLQEAAIQYLRTVRNSFNSWMEQAEKNITERLAHPLLRTQGLLSTYSRLKYKEYRKLNAKDLRAFNQFTKAQTPESIKRQEIAGYYREVSWTNDMLDSVEKVAAELTKLPEVKEGEGPIPCPNKTKLNELFEAIKREYNSKQKEKVGSVTSAYSKTQSFKLEGNPLMMKRLSDEKKNIISAKDSVKPLEKKIEREGSLLVEGTSTQRKTLTQESDQANEALTNITTETKEAKVEKERKLKRRRSSIDDKLDLKFGQAVDEKAKQYEERKKKLMESWERRQSQEKTEKKEEVQKVKEIQIDILKKKFWKKEQEVKENQKDKKKVEIIAEGSNQSNSDQNMNEPLREGLNFLQNAIQNILPPLPLPAKNQDTDEIIPKVIKIPFVARDVSDQIQSPILKSRKKQSSSTPSPSPFGITLNSASDSKDTEKDKIIEKKSEVTPFNRELGGSKTEKKEIMKVQQSQSAPDDLIVLEHRQKNSLLLFTEALKSESNRAIELLKASLKYSPNNLSAAEYLSYLYLEDGKAKECLQVCEVILVRIEDTPEEFELTLHLHNNRAAALNMLGRYSQSIMILEKCLRARRKHYFYKNLADAYFSLGIPEKAAMNYEKAIKLDPEYDEAYYNLAATQFMQDEYTSAMLNIRQARRIDKQNQTYQELQQEIIKRKENIPS